ncbi:type VI secretion system lipoprotein TssJ [Enterobacter bugandensis]|uniref:type VI secretion system lipoprotein TssJ n=1 Tax=Enterobacter bugandensis TaxID=881260 RepID=UPI001BE10410|nr:type VI secretion system lipoprotein TssJ [Enterobacter bugandensis]
MLPTSLIKTMRWLIPFMAISLTGCGVAQSVTDGTKSAFNSVFYKKIKILHLDFTAREALNIDARESNPLSEPVVVRVYQLKDRKIFDKTVYMQLLQDDTGLNVSTVSASVSDLLVEGGAFEISGIVLRYDGRAVKFMPIFLYGQGVAGCVEVTFCSGENVISQGQLFMRVGRGSDWIFTPPDTPSRSGQLFDEGIFFGLILALLP